MHSPKSKINGSKNVKDELQEMRNIAKEQVIVRVTLHYKMQYVQVFIQCELTRKKPNHPTKPKSSSISKFNVPTVHLILSSKREIFELVFVLRDILF